VRRNLPALLGTALLLLAAPAAWCRTQEGLLLTGGMDVSFEYLRDKGENDEYFSYPLHGTLGLEYESGAVSGLISVDVDGGADEPVAGPGESYLKAGEGASYITMGYTTARWGVSPGYSVVDILNPPDDRFPPTIFNVNRRRPSPLFVMSFGGGLTASEIAFSHRDEDIDSVNDETFGVRVSTLGSANTLGIGMIRQVGSPPPLFFLTFERTGESGNVWLELGWWSLPEREDELDGVIGFSQEFASASYELEFIVQNGKHFLRLYTRFLPAEYGLNLETFFFLPTFSSALDTYLSIPVDEKTEFDFGGRFFLGREGSHFSRLREDNDNALYFRLKTRF
jgi:hypothetical protein